MNVSLMVCLVGLVVLTFFVAHIDTNQPHHRLHSSSASTTDGSARQLVGAQRPRSSLALRTNQTYTFEVNDWTIKFFGPFELKIVNPGPALKGHTDDNTQLRMRVWQPHEFPRATWFSNRMYQVTSKLYFKKLSDASTGDSTPVHLELQVFKSGVSSCDYMSFPWGGKGTEFQPTAYNFTEDTPFGVMYPTGSPCRFANPVVPPGQYESSVMLKNNAGFYTAEAGRLYIDREHRSGTFRATDFTNLQGCLIDGMVFAFKC